MFSAPTIKRSARACFARLGAHIDLGQHALFAIRRFAFYLHITLTQLTLLTNTQATVCGNEYVVANDLTHETLFVIGLLV